VVWNLHLYHSSFSSAVMNQPLGRLIASQEIY
jgi:hypothetical protein